MTERLVKMLAKKDKKVDKSPFKTLLRAGLTEKEIVLMCDAITRACGGRDKLSQKEFDDIINTFTLAFIMGISFQELKNEEN